MNEVGSSDVKPQVLQRSADTARTRLVKAYTENFGHESSVFQPACRPRYNSSSPGTGTRMSDNVHIGFICQAGRLEAQSCVLAASIAAQLGRRVTMTAALAGVESDRNRPAGRTL